MGYNTLLFICNDALWDVEKNPEGFGKVMLSEIRRFETPNKIDNYFGYGSHGNGFEVVWKQHADVTGLVAVGQNCTTVLPPTDRVWFPGIKGHHTEEGQVAILKNVADKLGYVLHKKRKA